MEPRWIALAFCLLPSVGLAAGMARIHLQNRRTRAWAHAYGRIETARMVARTVRSKNFRLSRVGRRSDFIVDEKLNTRNVAEIGYAFSALGRTFTGRRIDLADRPGYDDPVGLLARYPQGKTVLVHYNPDDPADCILERDSAADLRNAWLGIAFLTGLVLAVFFAVTQGAEALHTTIPNPTRTPLVVALGVFSLASLLFAEIARRQRRTMRGWPSVEGEVVRSFVTTTTQKHHRPGLARDYAITMYVPRIVYAYEVGGRAFEGDDIGWSGSSNMRGTATKYVERYPVKTRVRVYYDPDDPTKATLAPAGGGLAIVLTLIAAGLAATAYVVGWLSV